MGCYNSPGREKNMKQLSICALVAALVSVAIFLLEDVLETDDGDLAATSAAVSDATNGAAASAVFPLRYTDALVEDTWVNAARQAGSDKRTLTSASSSVCYLTKIEISGSQGPDDTGSCAIEIDDFTGFWQVIATADEGGQSEVRCNARCLTWEPEGEEP
jgi:hypothetical protein